MYTLEYASGYGYYIALNGVEILIAKNGYEKNKEYMQRIVNKLNDVQ